LIVGKIQRLASVAVGMLRPIRIAVAVTAGVAFASVHGEVAAEEAIGANPMLAQVPQSQRIDPANLLQLKVRRLPDAIELIIEGTGPAPQLQQSSNGSGWQGQLFTALPAGLRVGPQRLSLPEVGMQAISFEGGGQSFALSVTPSPGINLGRPVVSADGRNMIVTFASPVPQASLQTSRPNLAQPGAVPVPIFAPPLQPRAVAPPLGDMAVGTMTLRNPGYLDLSGPPVTMTMKNAPAKDALMALAQAGGYGFAYVAEPSTRDGADPGSRPLSLSFRGESFGRAFNAALLASGLQGRREGRMILAGPNALSKTFGPQLSKIYRLNQVGPNAAADYLANLGASVTKTNTITTSVTQGASLAETVAGGVSAQTTESSSITTVEAFGASTGPLIGLRATTDTRLGTITLVGDPAIVSVAEQYLRKLDLRQRQVALNVRILDVNLDNVSDIDNSFALRWGSNFIVNDSGRLLGAFGRNLPPNQTAFQRSIPDDIKAEIDESGKVTITAPAGVDVTSFFTEDQIRAFRTSDGSGFNQSSGRARVGGGTAGVRPNPGLNYPQDFFDFLRAQIISGSTKLLASPTLILQENPSLLRAGDEGAGSSGSQSANQGIVNIGLDSPIGRRRANEGVVRVGTNVVTGYSTETPSQGGNVVCTPELSTAGLVLGARVEKIDDNGFVTFVLSPSVSAITGQELAPQGCGSNLNILSIRSLDTGALRVRDGQTLIMTGVISEFDREAVSKWPILGDIPLVGQFFRASNRRREKRELVIMVTPRIVDDQAGGVFGYGYQPSTPAVRDFMGGTPF
jgi:type IV pilus assembly protein PilQ